MIAIREAKDLNKISLDECGKILDLVSQGSGRRSTGPNHYKLNVHNLSLTH